ncbi:serine/threonine-protein kinase [Streptomyces sp. CG 926]|uniref:serine/threonine-protein kinase n=1 Tax=Streptomyces sp. CG 926 TaxID=1882405 RepID=UPI000D6B6EAD|nr:serine/threonine-protein kinase [Streptomyces sp. CG 926]PWK64489.1 serine/threonine-protein kinase [Streptomyces sp. CG 926]
MNTGDTTETAHRPWQVPGYTHRRELGAGAYGRVVEALDEASGTPVAIKYLTHGARTDFRAEARLLMALRSPHVVRVDDYVEHLDGAAIVMELVDGVSLRALLRQEGPTGPEAALTVLKGSLLGLAAAHDAGLVHRDYKPENVLVDLDGRSKLVDFGIAVAAGDASGIAGTPPYMAPEQWTGSPVAPVTDVYAATAVFFECLVGSKPYPGTTAVELAVQHIEAPIPDDRVPEALRPLIRRGLAKRAVERPPSAAAFVRELDALASGAYGEDWEARGRRRMAALRALLPILVRSPDDALTTTTSLADTTLATTTAAPSTTHGSPVGSGRPRSRGGAAGRGKVTVVAASAALLLGGVLTLSAIAEQDDAEAEVTGSAPRSPGAPGAPGAAVATDSPGVPGRPGSAADSRTAGPNSTVAPTTGPSGTATGPAAGSGVGGSTAADGSSSSAGAAPASTGQVAQPTPSTTNAAPGTPSVAPPVAPPTVRVLAVSLSQYGCYGKFGGQTVASVKTDGVATGTLILTWFHSNTQGPGPIVATDRITIPAGQTSFSRTYAHSFGVGDPYPYWGVQVSSSPAAATGSGTYKVLHADDCNPIL